MSVIRGLYHEQRDFKRCESSHFEKRPFSGTCRSGDYDMKSSLIYRLAFSLWNFDKETTLKTRRAEEAFRRGCDVFSTVAEARTSGGLGQVNRV